MKEEMTDKESIIKLSDSIEYVTFEFIRDHYKEITLMKLLNVILSGHISSLANCMRLAATKDETVKKDVNSFINHMVSAISEMLPIEKVEMIERV